MADKKSYPGKGGDKFRDQGFPGKKGPGDKARVPPPKKAGGGGRRKG